MSAFLRGPQYAEPEEQLDRARRLCAGMLERARRLELAIEITEDEFARAPGPSIEDALRCLYGRAHSARQRAERQRGTCAAMLEELRCG